MHHENRYINQNNENMPHSRILAQPQAAFLAAACPWRPPLMPMAPPSGPPGNSRHYLEKGRGVLGVERRGAPRSVRIGWIRWQTTPGRPGASPHGGLRVTHKPARATSAASAVLTLIFENGVRKTNPTL